MKHHVIYILLIILSSCAAKKQAAEFEAQPLWMKQKPVEYGYYIGVGSSKKVGTIQQYQEAAKKDALADLAEEISVNVSSTSVLHTIETQKGLSETYDQKIQISTDDYLEGFEPVDFYENENSYWVYYLISQAMYREKKEEKKQQALEAAKTKYLAGQKEEDQLHAREAISFYLQGLQAIAGYLNEETQTDINGATLDVGNELYASLIEVVSSLKIEADTSLASVKRGNSLDKPLRFTTFYKSEPEKGLPVKYAYSGGYLQKDSDVSNENGRVELWPGKITSKNKKEQITASINMEEMAQKAVDNLFIRGLLSKRKSEPAVVTINIESPEISMELVDQYCQQVSCDDIWKTFRESTLEEGFKSTGTDNADYVFTIKFNFKDGESAGGLYAIYLNGELSLTDKNQQQIWYKKIENKKGVGKSPNAARDAVFRDFVNDLDRLYFKQAFDKINR